MLNYERIPVLRCSHCQNGLEANTSSNGQFIEVECCELCVGELQAENERLKERFRWKDVETENPPENTRVLIRTFEDAPPIAGTYCWWIAKQRSAWRTSDGFVDLIKFPEWREIWEGEG